MPFEVNCGRRRASRLMARAGPNLGDGPSYGLTRYELAERVGLTMCWLNTYWLTMYGLTIVMAAPPPPCKCNDLVPPM
jgi:hypothetical protein